MLDNDLLDQLYDDELKATGDSPFYMALFDKRVLLPITQLPDSVVNETGEVLSAERAASLVQEGWIPGICSVESRGLGFPLYVPSRVGLLLHLERDGWSAPELAAIAEQEEALIDDILVAEDTPYEDDDVLTVIGAYQDQVDEYERQLAWLDESVRRAWSDIQPAGAEDAAGISSHLEGLHKALRLLRAKPWEAMSEALRGRIRRAAFKIRFNHEYVRLLLISEDRATIAQGYSFFIQFDGYKSNGLRPQDFAFEQINWQRTLKSGWLTGEDDALPIRLPGLVIRNDEVTQIHRLIPSEYGELWKRYDLEAYFKHFAKREGQRICERCLRPLGHSSVPRKKYADLRARMLQRRRHTERVIRSRLKRRATNGRMPDPMNAFTGVECALFPLNEKNPASGPSQLHSSGGGSRSDRSQLAVAYPLLYFPSK